MNRTRFLRVATAAVIGSPPLLRAAGTAPGFTAGGAVRDITPPVGISLNGAISRGGPSRGNHDPLKVRAAVLGAGAARVALAVVDACFLDEPVFTRARGLVERATGIPGSHLLISATHTHAAPRPPAMGRLSPLDDAWHDALPGAIAAAVAEADARREPARLSAGALAVPELTQTRRFRIDPAGAPPNPFGERGEQVASAQSILVPRLGPAGPVDPDCGLLHAVRPDGSPILLLGNLSLHYCGGYAGLQVSADYFGAFCGALEKTLGARTGGRPFTALHTNGTSGDIGALGTPAEFAGRTFAPFERGEVIGAWLAARVVAHLPRLVPVGPARVAARERVLACAVRKPSPARIAWAEQLLAGRERGPHPRSRTYADEVLQLRDYPATKELRVQVLRLGDRAIAASPCETFAETGLAIKAAAPGRVFTIGLANGYGGYLPTAGQHELGGYETWMARSSCLEVGAEARLRQTLIELVRA